MDAIPAAYPGFCPVCEEKIEEGDPIVRHEDGDWVHEGVRGRLMAWDALKIADAEKKPKRPLTCSGEKTCVLCDGPLSDGDWYVSLGRAAPAHTHCASDRGWEIR